MKVPFFDPTREYLLYRADFDAAISEVMARGDFILGKAVSEFESRAAAYLGAKHAIGVASGTDALVIGADILGFKHGAKVIMPAYSFFASASCVARLGGVPVFTDIDEQTLCLDLDPFDRLCDEGASGVLPVHLFAQTASMQRVMDAARERGLAVLEDAAEAWGMSSLIDGAWRKAGTIGDIGAFSFFPTKTLGAYGDAGLIVTESDDLAAKIRSYRVHGSVAKYEHRYLGYNSRLDSIQAAVLNVKLSRIGDSIEARARHAAHYTSRLGGRAGIRLISAADDCAPVSYVFNILIEGRDALARRLYERGIGTSVYYPKPLHLQECFAGLGYKEGDFPVAERVSKRILALPMFPELGDDEVDYVCDEILAFMGGA